MRINNKLLPFFVAASGIAAAAPTVSVSSVTATTNPVLRSSSGVTITATIAATFDSSSGPTTVNGSCQGKVRTNTVTTVTVTNKLLTVTTSDPYNAKTETFAGGAYSVTLDPPPSNATDGSKAVSLSATVDEDVNTQVVTTVLTYPSAPCGGSPTSQESTTNTPEHRTKSASGNTSYTLDINGPTISFVPDTGQPTVRQGQTKLLHNRIFEGSANTAYSVTDTITGPGGYTKDFTDSGTFGGGNPPNSGIAGNKNDLIGMKIACDAPLGDYSASSALDAVDLGSFAYPTVYSSNSDTFTVQAGVLLDSQTDVVSEMNGDYQPMSCFTSTQGKNGKVSTYPGSFHITTVISSTGPCADVATLSGAKIKFTLPTAFKFDVTGASPPAHAFIFASNTSGFDYHYPGPETTVLPKPTVSGQDLTVDLSNVDLGLGKGVIPSGNSIYVRAHISYASSLPTDGTVYTFNTSAEASFDGGTTTSTTTSSGTLTASNPNACVNGILIP